MARAGFDQQWFAAGMSVKLQDGIGSEGQKMYNEHVGADIMFRRGNWTFFGSDQGGKTALRVCIRRV